jgi:thymidine kinase
MENYKEPGWIEVVTGPMFAGKSEELIRRIRRLTYAHKKVLVFKPKIDNRYSENDIESHLHNKADAINITSSKEILPYIKGQIDAVVIDEVQFLDPGIYDVCNLLADKGIRVIVGGLDQDFRGEPFLITAKLMAKAEFVTKLTAICVKCGAPATMTQRIVDGVPASYDEPTIKVGASDSYEPRCRHCHEVRHTK